MDAPYCLPIALPLTHDDLTKYKAIRLQALWTDPHAFGSNYEREIQFTDEQWRSRIDTDQIITIAARSRVPQSPGESVMVEHWVGIGSILTPQFLRSLQVALPSLPGAEDLDVYILIGMWVHPEHRRKGLAKLLIETGVEVVQRDKSEKARKALMLEVYDSNEAGKSLYLNNGFTICEGPGSGAGRIWMWKFIQKS